MAEIVSLKQNVKETVQALAIAAREAYQALAETDSEHKVKALREAAKAIRTNEKAILEANAKDMDGARKAGLDAALLDRLELNPKRIEAMAKGLEDIADLPDPVGKILSETTRPNGLKIQQVSVPLGVIGIIYESRPNVTADAGGLCLKSGNAAILRGGSEGFNSSQAIVRCLHEGLKAAGLPEASIQLIPTTDRALVGEMLSAHGLIDVIIPRGGKSLTGRVMTESRVPTLLHLDGNCHTYIHKDADAAMAEEIVVNAKMRRTGVCGATESLLIDESVAASILPRITDALANAGCELRGDDKSRAIDSRIAEATEEDWATEYLAPIISIKVVSGVNDAVRHINSYGSHHTDAIITKDAQAAKTFLKEVDSAIVLHNASTQFADGGEFGMGAEIGIATGRLHARGPVGCAQLTTYKYVVLGSGQTRPV